MSKLTVFALLECLNLLLERFHVDVFCQQVACQWRDALGAGLSPQNVSLGRTKTGKSPSLQSRHKSGSTAHTGGGRRGSTAGDTSMRWGNKDDATRHCK